MSDLADSKGVCLLASSYPSPASPTRGAFVEDIALGLADTRPVTVVAPLIYPDDPQYEDRKGLPVRRFGFGAKGVLLKEYGGTPLGLMLRYMLSGLMTTLRSARRQRLIFAHWVLPAGVIGAAASWLTGRPLAVYAHGSDICVYAEKSALYRLLTRFVLARSRHVFAVSRDIEQRLIGRFGVAPERISIISCGVDTALFYAPPEAPEVSPVRRFLFVGDLVPGKGVAELMAAARALHQRGVPFALEVVGDGPLRDAPQVTEGIGPVTFHGTVSRVEVAALLGRVDCLVLPSHNEGTPVCIMEALSAGVPVLATRVGGIPDMVSEGENGLLVAPHDVDALTAALERIIHEPGLWARLSTHARTTGQRFSLAQRRREVCQAIDALLGDANLRP